MGGQTGTMGKTRTLERRKGAAPALLFSVFLGSVNAEALGESDLRLRF
jgi:hypothetical protein